MNSRKLSHGELADKLQSHYDAQYKAYGDQISPFSAFGMNFQTVYEIIVALRDAAALAQQACKCSLGAGTHFVGCALAQQPKCGSNGNGMCAYLRAEQQAQPGHWPRCGPPKPKCEHGLDDRT